MISGFLVPTTCLGTCAKTVPGAYSKKAAPGISRRDKAASDRFCTALRISSHASPNDHCQHPVAVAKSRKNENLKAKCPAFLMGTPELKTIFLHHPVMGLDCTLALGLAARALA